MQIEKRLAIFDLDGTLVDSVEQIGAVLNASRSLFGYSQLPQTFYRDSVGLPLDFLISDLDISGEDKNALIRRFREKLVETIQQENNLIFEGVVEILNYFQNKGVELAIATSKPTDIAVQVHRNSELAAFSFLIQGTDGFPAKPDPEVINRVLKKFPERKAVMIGDRSEDVIAAQRAHIKGIGVAASAHSQQYLRDAGASHTFESMKDFNQALIANSSTLSEIFN